MLGSNDVKSINWDLDSYVRDYKEMVKIFKTLNPSPKVFLVIPPPVYEDGAFEIKQSTANEVLPKVIRDIAKDLNLSFNVIDNFNALGGGDLKMPELIPDGVHPNDAGSKIIAMQVLEKVFPDHKAIS